MNKQNSASQKQYIFASNKKYQHFDQFRLSKQDPTMIDLISYTDSKPNKVKALVSGCIKRSSKLLYKGEKYFIQDLQIILTKYPQEAPAIMKKYNLVLNKSNSKVNVQCHSCANYTDIYKFCPTCEHVHYCHQGCEMKIKFTHQKQQCRIRPFPKIYKALQVEIHVGSDLARNVHLNFQHQVSMTLLFRGQKLLQQIFRYFQTTQGSALIDDYQIKNQNKMIKFQKDIKDPNVEEEKLNIDKMEDICALYTQNKILRELQLFLLENGAILWKNIREIYDNHFREVFIYHYP